MLYDARQQRVDDEVINHEPGEAQASIQRAIGCVKIYKDGTAWKIRDHSSATNASPKQLGGEYVPPFTVRKFKVEGSNHQIHCDMVYMPSVGRGQTGHAVDLYSPEIMHEGQITKLYLDALTTVDAITLYV